MKQTSDIEAALKGKKPGDVIKAKVEQRTGPREVEIKLGKPPDFELVTYRSRGPGVERLAGFAAEAWLSSKAKQRLPELHKYCTRCKPALLFEFAKCPYDGTDLRIAP